MHTIWSKEYSTLYLYSPLICAFVHTKKERGGMEIMRAFLLVGIIASLISAASAIGGTATFYSKYVRKCLYNVEWLFELFFFFWISKTLWTPEYQNMYIYVYIIKLVMMGKKHVGYILVKIIYYYFSTTSVLTSFEFRSHGPPSSFTM